MLQNPDRQKRGAEDAFGREKSSDFLQREAFGDSGSKERIATGIQDISTRMMAHMLGLDIPGIEPSTSYYPGYEWWPRTTNATQPPYQQPPPVVNAPNSESLMNTNYAPAPGWRPSAGYPYDFLESPNGYRM